ncbi:MAG: helix-turn-helix domain-containing protein [Methylococcales bacterium]
MTALTEYQIIVGSDGKPAFVVIPYACFEELQGSIARGAVPNEVVTAVFDRDLSPMAAWREHLGLTQAEVAARMEIAETDYARMECIKRPRKAKLEKAAIAMGLKVEQLRW